jgi:hypothetical protein
VKKYGEISPNITCGMEMTFLKQALDRAPTLFESSYVHQSPNRHNKKTGPSSAPKLPAT